MSLRLPARFLRGASDRRPPRYVRTSDQDQDQDQDNGVTSAQPTWRWYHWFGHCAMWVWNRKELRRRRKLNSAIARCETARVSMEKQLDVTGLKVNACRSYVRKFMKENNKKSALQKLKQQKRLESQQSRLQVQYDEMERKIMVLNELLSDSDVTNVIKNVAGAMDGLDVNQQLSDLEDADTLISESLDDAVELSQRLDDTARQNLRQSVCDDESLEAELESILAGNGDSPPSDGATALRPVFPEAPNGMVFSIPDCPVITAVPVQIS